MSFPLAAGASEPESYSSVQLFLHHAQRAQPHFKPTEKDRQQISRICTLLEGMPLGIELAAAWVNVMSCADIAAEIEGNLDFLTADQQGVAPRHRRLRAVFNHTWESLSAAERQNFRKLSIFKGGFTKKAAREVAGVDFPQLSALLEKSLVYRRKDGRYNLHDILNQFAAEKLAANPLEQNKLRDTHRKYYLDLLMRSTDELVGASQIGALQRLPVESANVRAAWYRTVAQGSLDELERITLRLMVYYILRGLHREGAETFRPALDRLRREQGLRFR